MSGWGGRQERRKRNYYVDLGNLFVAVLNMKQMGRKTKEKEVKSNALRKKM